MTLMLSMCLSTLLKCGWGSGFVSAGSKKKKELLTVGLIYGTHCRIKGGSISPEAGNVPTML